MHHRANAKRGADGLRSEQLQLAGDGGADGGSGNDHLGGDHDSAESDEDAVKLHARR